MSDQSSQDFLRELDKKLWTAADRLRSNLDAAVYSRAERDRYRLRGNRRVDAGASINHAVLGLIFLKYVSDSFAQRQAEIETILKDPESDFFMDPADYNTPAKYADAIHSELEERDYYLEKNVFWVPALARWKTMQDSATLPRGTEITVKNGKTSTYKISSTGKLIDDALEAIEKENPKLKGVLDRRYTRLQIDPANLSSLIDLIASIPFQHADLHAKDILGHVYQYFLGKFALAEGKSGGQYFTPKSIVGLIVEMNEPYQGRVYDPAMGSGGFFVSSERFIEEHGGKLGNLSVYGQDQWAWGTHLRRAKRARRVRLRRKQPNQSNPTTWRLAAMNMAIRGIDFNFGKEPANSFTQDQHPDLRADCVMANPPFNIKEWWDGKLEGDARWSRSEAETAPQNKFYRIWGKYGNPPQGNANLAWVQHMLHHLAPNGSMALLLANGSMSSNSSGEGDIRRALIEADLVESMVALPGRPFTNTQIPACIWFLTKNKAKRTRPGATALRDRRGETLFIDARKLGFMKDRVLRDFAPEDTEKIAGIFREWRSGTYEDVSGFCKSATLQEITSHGHVLTPGRYVGAEDIEDDGEAFDEKMTRFTSDLKSQFTESAKLEAAIKANLKGLGYGF